MWVANVGLISDALYNKSRWKFWKKVFNLIKNWSQWGRAILLFYINRKKLRDIQKELDKHDSLVCGSENLKATELMRKFITQHSNVYDQMFVIIRNTVRIMQLNYKLEIVFWKDIFHPIFICFLGIFQNITALFKIWLKKRYN